MGYAIYIGERNEYTEDGETYVDVEVVEHPNTAPQYVGDELTGCSNQRHPSYTGWGEFTRATGMDELFSKLFAEHPGDYPLTPELLDEFRAANQAYGDRYPDVTPGFDGEKIDGEYVASHMARLDWLIYWTAWAINNCKRPVIVNR